MELLEVFLYRTTMLENVGELLLHKPWTNKGKTYFRLADLVERLHRHNFKEYQRNRLTY